MTRPSFEPATVAKSEANAIQESRNALPCPAHEEVLRRSNHDERKYHYEDWPIFVFAVSRSAARYVWNDVDVWADGALGWNASGATTILDLAISGGQEIKGDAADKKSPNGLGPVGVELRKASINRLD